MPKKPIDKFTVSRVLVLNSVKMSFVHARAFHQKLIAKKSGAVNCAAFKVLKGLNIS